MSDSQANPASEDPAPEAAGARRRVPTRTLVAIGAAAAILIGAVVTTIVIAARPSPIEQAGESCAASKPLDAFLADVRATASATPEPVDTADSDALDELFDGVVSVEDDGKTLIVQTKPKDDDPLGITGLALDCVYEQLDVPTRITERIAATRSLDGRQEAEWEDYSASWSYHPDSGANLIIAQD
ncbi:hypothetical protein [uncultured Microbacterium sp.]|uniref:hypothetical protein n=1 Tax=uncultured Microbacterium sp. TaxID=191216 RepID=UPI002628EA99|nr:hypothetical protein [uncultured Microbacterium sp.]